MLPFGINELSHFQAEDPVYAPAWDAVNLTVIWDFGWTTCSRPKAWIAKPCGSSNLLMRVSSTSSPCWTMRLEGSQILVPSRSTVIKVNFLGSAAVAEPRLSIRTVSRTPNQPSRRLHPWVLCTVMSPWLRHVRHPGVPLSLQRRPPLSWKKYVRITPGTPQAVLVPSLRW